MSEKTQAVIIAENRQQFVQKLKEARDQAVNGLGNPGDPLETISLEDAAVGIDVMVESTLKIIDGAGKDDGYFLIPREPDLALMPATKECWEDCNNSIAFTTGLDISGSLTDLFKDINN